MKAIDKTTVFIRGEFIKRLFENGGLSSMTTESYEKLTEFIEYTIETIWKESQDDFAYSVLRVFGQSSNPPTFTYEQIKSWIQVKVPDIDLEDERGKNE